MEEITKGLFLKRTNINLVNLRESCNLIYNKIKLLPLDDNWYNNDGQPNAPNTTKSFNQYNVLTFPLPQIHELFTEIKTVLYECERKYYGTNLKCNYFIQAWLNVYKKGQFIDWHSHRYDVARAWHGFICISTEPSETIYKFDDQIINVPSKDNQIVLGISENNKHKTNPWPFSDRDRITIAFDIIDRIGLRDVNPNHWIPI